MPVSAGLRFKVLRRDGFKCRYCGAEPDGTQLHVDHVIPKSKGGPDLEWNLVAACFQCNSGKGVSPANKFYLVDYLWKCCGLSLADPLGESTVLLEAQHYNDPGRSVDELLDRLSLSAIDNLIEIVDHQGGVVREWGKGFSVERSFEQCGTEYEDLVFLCNQELPQFSAQEVLYEHLSPGSYPVLCWGRS